MIIDATLAYSIHLQGLQSTLWRVTADLDSSVHWAVGHPCQEHSQQLHAWMRMWLILMRIQYPQHCYCCCPSFGQCKPFSELDPYCCHHSCILCPSPGVLQVPLGLCWSFSTLTLLVAHQQINKFLFQAFHHSNSKLLENHTNTF